MRVGAYRIRVAPLPAVIALIMLALLLWAGFWQLERAEEKRRVNVAQAYRGDKTPVDLRPDLLDSQETGRMTYRRASASGRYRWDRQYLLDNRTHRGVAGYHVLTPLRLEDGDVHVLVNRGWLPVGPDRGRLPDVTVSGQPLVVEGVIVAPPAAGLALGSSGYDDQGWPRVVQHVDLERIAAQLGESLLPFVVRLSPDSDHGYVREWRIRTGLSPERHVGYAFQWFAMAVALVALCLWVTVRRAPETDDAP
jgi:surfeit locus 1 family protein